MAFIQGNPVEGLQQTVTRHLFFMGVVTLVLSGMMFAISDDPIAEIGTIAAITFACAGLIAFVSFRANPLALTMLFKPERFKEAVTEEENVIRQLENLSDRCYVFNNLTVELFRIDHLVISPWGIFVMGRVRKDGELQIKGDILHAGDASLETLCANTWRICHLLNIIIRKGWSEEVMPRPVIVPRPGQLCRDASVDGMVVVAPEDLASHIETGDNTSIREELVDSVAAYLHKRYTS